MDDGIFDKEAVVNDDGANEADTSGLSPDDADENNVLTPPTSDSSEDRIFIAPGLAT